MKTPLLSIVLFIGLTAHGQNSLDKVEKLIDGNAYDSAVVVLESILGSSLDKDTITAANLFLIEAYLKSQDIQEANEILSSIDIRQQSLQKNLNLLAHFYQLKDSYYDQIGDTLKEVEYHNLLQSLDKGLNQYTVGDSLSRLYQFEEVLEPFLEAYEHLKSAKAYDKALYSKGRYIETLMRTGRHSKADSLADEYIQEARTLYPENPALEAFGYLNKALIFYVFKADYDQAVEECLKARPLLEALEPSGLLLICYNYLGVINYSKSDYPGAIYYYQKNLTIAPYVYSSENIILEYQAKMYNNIANANSKMGDFEESVTYHSKALTIRKQLFGDQHEEIARSYLNLGNALFLSGYYELSIDYHKQALDICKNLASPNARLLFHTYHALGVSSSELGYYDEAIGYFNQSLELKRKTVDPDDPELTITLMTLASTYSQKGDFEASIRYLKLCQRRAEEFFGDSVFLAEIYDFLGSTYLENHQLEQAIYWFELAEKLRIDIRSAPTHRISGTYFLAKAYYQANNSEKAKKWINECLRINNDSSGYINPEIAFKSISLKALIDSEGLQSTNTDDLDEALDFVRNSRNILSNINDFNISYEDQLNLSEAQSKQYDLSVALASQLYSLTNDLKYADFALEFSEFNKSSVLKRLFKDLRLPSSEVSDSLRNSEYATRYRISSLRTEELKAGESMNDSLKNQLRKKRFMEERRYDSLLARIQDEFPDFYAIRLSDKIVTKEELIAQLGDRLMISYHATDSVIYCVAFDQQETFFLDIKMTDSLVVALQYFLNSLSSTENANVDKFQQYGHYLYKELLQNVLEKSPSKSIVILPDGDLLRLPFETLISSLQSNPSFANLNYLIKSHTFSYATSGQIWLENTRNQKKKRSYPMIAFAPTYGNEVARSDFDASRNDLFELKWNTEEVRRIGQYFDQEMILNEEATETSFKENAGNYEMIHLATHGIVNDRLPMLSKLAFYSSEEDSVNDGFIHMQELFGLNLNAELVVISACNSGSGKISKGEGTLSLAQGFFYAGAQCVVMSLWAVNDRSSADIMEHFYENLSKGFSKDEAIRLAKLAYIQTSDPISTHPFYWASFLPSGNMRPINHDKSYWYFFVAFVAILLTVGTFYFFGKANQSAPKAR